MGLQCDERLQVYSPTRKGLLRPTIDETGADVGKKLMSLLHPSVDVVRVVIALKEAEACGRERLYTYG